jgi:hypothetical protein
MTDRNDSQLDSLLTKHLSSQLDRQLGRSEERFEQMIRMQRQLQTAPETKPQKFRINRFMLGLVGAAMAASIAVVFVLPHVVQLNRHPSTDGQFASTRPHIAEVPSPVETIPVEREVSWRTLDRGTVFVGEDEQPMRGLVRQRVDNFRWSDPSSNTKVEVSVPHDEVMLVGMKSQ